MTVEEAEKILGIDSKMAYDEVLKVLQGCHTCCVLHLH